MAVQRTFFDEEVGEKVTVHISARSYMGNFCGYNVRVNGEKFMINVLEAKMAESIALRRWRDKKGGNNG